MEYSKDRSCMDCIYLAQDRKYWATVNTVMNLPVP